MEALGLTSGALRLGPLLLPLELLLLMASIAASLVVGRRLAQPLNVALEGLLWRTLLVGALAARLAFIFEYRSLYFASPLAMLDVRDGGWNAGVGLAAAWLYALHRSRSDPRSARPLRWALVTGTTLFVLGSALLAVRPDSGQRLPELQLTTIEGRPVELAAFAGKPLVINLWATWCPPCVREMPVFEAAQARRKDVHFIFVNQGEDRATVNPWLAQHSPALENVMLDEHRRASAAFKSLGYPTTLFFDARGVLVSRRIGEVSAATLAERLEQIAP